MYLSGKIPTANLGRHYNPHVTDEKWRLRVQKGLAQTTQLESGGSGRDFNPGFPGGSSFWPCTLFSSLLESPSSVAQGAASWAPAPAGSGWGILDPVFPGGLLVEILFHLLLVLQPQHLHLDLRDLLLMCLCPGSPIGGLQSTRVARHCEAICLELFAVQLLAQPFQDQLLPQERGDRM